VITGILLAAGRGRRFGGAKLMARLASPKASAGSGIEIGAMACRQLRSVLPRVIAVVRPDDADLAASLSNAGAEVIVFADADRGMGASLAFGVAAAPQARGWVVALADMPWVLADTLRAVAAALAAGAPIAAPFHDGRRGHPVGFGRALLPELLELSGDEGARRILAAAGERVVRIDVDDPGILRDVDYRKDLQAD
jgi:molybdenum cofactor cytidylyltransferase